MIYSLESDEYCPHCDNKYVLDAVTKDERWGNNEWRNRDDLNILFFALLIFIWFVFIECWMIGKRSMKVSSKKNGVYIKWKWNFFSFFSYKSLFKENKMSFFYLKREREIMQNEKRINKHESESIQLKTVYKLFFLIYKLFSAWAHKCFIG